MKRALLAASAAAVLALTGCAADDDTTTAEETTAAATETTPAATETTASSTDTTDATGGLTVVELNQQVRDACQAAVTERLPGAEFTTRGNLRAASQEGGKIYTVTGTAQADGTGHPYTCTVSVLGEETTVDEVLVDGE
ncbi:hypothetical protein ACFP6A_12235 [Quadrisphaera sp. GCM10027208]|uniref:hypothetical protein n=1 Tax=Quadrisphaera sp. GCM10027208 TaxID=3273423 RepID=UPI0036094CC7|nr:hypothetical protein HJG43_07205 [Kineosporiaceae bacterium SCSIO 59966]